jgi:hypothetical protein
MPCGRTTEDEDEDDQRADVLQLGRDHQGRQLGEDADDQAADERAEGRAEPAERDAGEQQQQDLEARAGS